MKNNEKLDEKVEFLHLKSNSNKYINLARIESLKKSSGIMVVRGRTLPGLTSSNRVDHGSNRNDLSKCFMNLFFIHLISCCFH